MVINKYPHIVFNASIKVLIHSEEYIPDSGSTNANKILGYRLRLTEIHKLTDTVYIE